MSNTWLMVRSLQLHVLTTWKCSGLLVLFLLWRYKDLQIWSSCNPKSRRRCIKCMYKMTLTKMSLLWILLNLKKQHPNADIFFFFWTTLLKCIYTFLKSGNHGCKPVEKNLMHCGKEQWISGLPLWPESRLGTSALRVKLCDGGRGEERASERGTESYFMKQLY